MLCSLIDCLYKWCIHVYVISVKTYSKYTTLYIILYIVYIYMYIYILQQIFAAAFILHCFLIFTLTKKKKTNKKTDLNIWYIVKGK